MKHQEESMKSVIVEFYNKRSVLVTGGTGFLGGCLIEKLLRTCTSVESIYVLIRPKRDEKASERIEELLKKPLFDQVRQQDKLLEKIVAVEGDVSQPDLGLNDQNLSIIKDRVSVVYHAAATVKLDGPLKEAISINLTGTRNVLEVCKKLNNLTSLVHISTAYTNCDQHLEIDDHVYPVANFKAKNLIELANLMDEDSLQSLKGRFLSQAKKPNTYSFTESLAELLLVEEGARLPVVICRPSNIGSTWKEPFSGWTEGYMGASGFVAPTLKGINVFLSGKKNCRSDIVPADLVTNMIVALGWFAHINQLHKNNSHSKCSSYSESLDQLHFGTRTKLREKNLDEKFANVPVFHSTQAAKVFLTFNMFQNCVNRYVNKYPSISTFIYPNMTFIENSLLFEFCQFALEDVPAFIGDSLVKLQGSGRGNLVKVRKKIKQMRFLLKFFTHTEWIFNSSNRDLLINELMSDEDRRLFDLDMSSLDWSSYMEDYVLGVRRFILKEPTDNLTKARNNLKTLQFFRNTVLLTFMALISVIFIHGSGLLYS